MLVEDAGLLFLQDALVGAFGRVVLHACLEVFDFLPVDRVLRVFDGRGLRLAQAEALLLLAFLLLAVLEPLELSPDGGRVHRDLVELVFEVRPEGLGLHQVFLAFALSSQLSRERHLSVCLFFLQLRAPDLYQPVGVGVPVVFFDLSRPLQKVHLVCLRLMHVVDEVVLYLSFLLVQCAEDIVLQRFFRVDALEVLQVGLDDEPVDLVVFVEALREGGVL